MPTKSYFFHRHIVLFIITYMALRTCQAKFTKVLTLESLERFPFLQPRGLETSSCGDIAGHRGISSLLLRRGAGRTPTSEQPYKVYISKHRNGNVFP